MAVAGIPAAVIDGTHTSAAQAVLSDTPPMGAQGAAPIRLSRVIGGLSYALDLTEGEPAGHAVRSCVIGMRIADELQLDADTRSHLFYALLMKDAGCSANSAKMAALFGADDHEAKRTAKRSNWSRRFPALVWSLRIVAPDGSFRARAARLRAIKEEGQVTRSLMLARCDRGAEIALLLGLAPEERGRDPYARRALGRQRPAPPPQARGDPAARAHRVPRADGRDLPRRGRAGGGVRGRRPPQRRVV